MKIGFRTSSLKRSFKARTTAKLKRSVKKTVLPLSGRKGMGALLHPKRSVRNAIYNKTTINPLKWFKSLFE